jgi:hypothetical protein
MDRQALLRECRACRLRLRDGTEVRGALLDVGSDSLGVRSWKRASRTPFGPWAKGRTAVPFDRIASITCGEDDRSWDGPLLGFLAGGLPAGLMAAWVVSAMREPGYEYSGSPALRAFGLGTAVGGGIGALVGYIFDSAFEHRQRDFDETSLREAWERAP